MLTALGHLPLIIFKGIPSLYLLYRSYDMEDMILIVLGLLFFIWLFD